MWKKNIDFSMHLEEYFQNKSKFEGMVQNKLY